MALRVTTGLRNDMTLMQQEISGPFLPPVPGGTLDRAIAGTDSRPTRGCREDREALP